jgi:hypothetical protein
MDPNSGIWSRSIYSFPALTGDGIPEAAWRRPLGLPLDNAGVTRVRLWLRALRQGYAVSPVDGIVGRWTQRFLNARARFFPVFAALDVNELSINSQNPGFTPAPPPDRRYLPFCTSSCDDSKGRSLELNWLAAVKFARYISRAYPRPGVRCKDAGF